MPRIAIAGFQHESNSFSPTPTTLEEFEMADSWPGMLSGEDVIAGTDGMNLPIAGFAAAAAGAGASLIPILWCAAEPAGHVEADAFDTIVSRILDGLRTAGPLEGIYLDLHGAMITETSTDGEGELLARIRALVGPDLPIVASLDLHANISARMVDLSSVLCIFRTYPHVDMAQTGARSWDMMRLCLSGSCPAKAFRRAPFMVPVPAQHTDAPPASKLYAELPNTDTTLVEMALGFTASDTPDRGPSIVAYARTEAEAAEVANAALARLESARADFDIDLLSPEAAVARAMAHRGARPIVLADVQDNPGAGASSDTTGILRALVAAGAQGALLGLMHDPVLAAKAHAAGLGSDVPGAIGGRSGIAEDEPFAGVFRVEALTDGICRYTGDMYKGGIGHLGPSCVLSLPQTGSGVLVAVTSLRNQCLDLAHFTSFGLDPEAARIVCVKSTAHFRAAFTSVADEILMVASAGLFPCKDIESLNRARSRSRANISGSI